MPSSELNVHRKVFVFKYNGINLPLQDKKRKLEGQKKNQNLKLQNNYFIVQIEE